MKKILLALSIMLMLNACAPQSTPEPAVTKTTGQEWTVTKSTYIYDSPSFDSSTKGELAVGDIVMLPAGVTSLECKTISETGLSATLCYFRAKRSGIEGWVLKKWVD
ncbi:MAG TPA: hypothetical protein PLH64_02370 [Anaerolineaceae bacterium]|nr:hypothetical protein [Anaerolineaceae bacterium]